LTENRLSWRHFSSHAAFIHCIILPLCQLLQLNDDDDLTITLYLLPIITIFTDQTGLVGFKRIPLEM